LVITIDADNRDEFSSAQTQIINRNVYSEDINASGNRFRYKFLETGITESWEFEGMSMTTDIKEDEK